jgi:predicted NBD/HSP70 family sugar kinase
MNHRLTITASDMREINRSAILEIIRRESPISRTAIAQRLEVSLPTVMRIVDVLVDEGFVRHQGRTEWSGGRRRPLLEFNAESFVVVGVDMGGTQFYGAVSDLGGRIIAEANMGRHSSSGEENYTRLVELIDALLASPKLQERRVRGIGVGAPGITHHQEGVVQWAYSLSWRDFPLKARLGERYHLPITVDNDVNLAAMGELWFGAGQDAQDMILVTCGAGIGAGIIIDGALYRGAHEASGEIGSFIPGPGFLGGDYRQFGAFESVASGFGIVTRARLSLEGLRDPVDLASLTMDDIFIAARQGQSWTVPILAEMVDYLAVAVANLAVSFDPQLIVLGGAVTPFADLLVDPILQRIQGAIPTPPKLVISSLGLRAGVMGAITNVLHHTSNFYIVRKLS